MKKIDDEDYRYIKMHIEVIEDIINQFGLHGIDDNIKMKNMKSHIEWIEYWIKDIKERLE